MDMNSAYIAILVLLLLVGIGGRQSKIEKYITEHPETPKLYQEAMKKNIVLNGMTRENVETMFRKGELTSLQGTPAYRYIVPGFMQRTDWYVVYDSNDKVIWANSALIDTSPSSDKQRDISKSEYMLQQMQLQELNRINNKNY